MLSELHLISLHSFSNIQFVFKFAGVFSPILQPMLCSHLRIRLGFTSEKTLFLCQGTDLY